MELRTVSTYAIGSALRGPDYAQPFEYKVTDRLSAECRKSSDARALVKSWAARHPERVVVTENAHSTIVASVYGQPSAEYLIMIEAAGPTDDAGIAVMRVTVKMYRAAVLLWAESTWEVIPIDDGEEVRAVVDELHRQLRGFYDC